MKNQVKCSNCGEAVEVYKNPIPTVDIIISMDQRGVILIKRKNPPFGWALPGGFIDYGETAEDAAEREAKEETGISVSGLRQFKVYSDPDRDPRGHTLTVVFTAMGKGAPKADDDAIDLEIFTVETLPEEIAFDHREILRDYFSSL